MKRLGYALILALITVGSLWGGCHISDFRKAHAPKVKADGIPCIPGKPCPGRPGA